MIAAGKGCVAWSGHSLRASESRFVAPCRGRDGGSGVSGLGTRGLLAAGLLAKFALLFFLLFGLGVLLGPMTRRRQVGLPVGMRTIARVGSGRRWCGSVFRGPYGTGAE